MGRRKHEPRFSYELIHKKYILEEKSFRVICAELNAKHSNEIRSAVIYYGIKIRDKSESVKAACRAGRLVSPTKGKTLTTQERDLIGRRLHEEYGKKGDEYKKYRSDIGKNNYSNMTEQQVELFRRRSSEALKEVSQEGSALEKFLKIRLAEKGHIVYTQAENVVENENLKFDLYLPNEKILIEVDGVFHTDNIFNEDIKYQKRLARDEQKNRMAEQNGFVMIRIPYPKKLSKIGKLEVFEKLYSVIMKLMNGFPPPGERIIKLEV